VKPSILELENDFETWAHLAAKLRVLKSDESERLLRSLGLSDRWDALHERWAGELNAEIARGELARPTRYREICAKETGQTDLGERSFRDELIHRPVAPPARDQVKTLAPDFRHELTPRLVVRPKPNADTVEIPAVAQEDRPSKPRAESDSPPVAPAKQADAFYEELHDGAVVKPFREQATTLNQGDIQAVLAAPFADGVVDETDVAGQDGEAKAPADPSQVTTRPFRKKDG
jgi:hypothetical protein